MIITTRQNAAKQRLAETHVLSYACMEPIFRKHGRYYMYTVLTKALIPIVGDYEIFHDSAIVHTHNNKNYDLININ